MNYQKSMESGGSVIALEGAFTFKDHLAFRAILNDLNTNAGLRHVFDLSKLEFLDSAALGMMLIAEDEAQAGGWSLSLRRPSGEVAKLLALSSMDTVFDIEE